MALRRVSKKSDFDCLTLKFDEMPKKTHNLRGIKMRFELLVSVSQGTCWARTVIRR